MDDWVRGGQDASPVRTTAATSTEGLKRRQTYSGPILRKRFRRREDKKISMSGLKRIFFFFLPPVATHKISSYNTPKTQLLFTTTAMKWVLLVRRQCGISVGNSLVCGGRKKKVLNVF